MLLDVLLTLAYIAVLFTEFWLIKGNTNHILSFSSLNAGSSTCFCAHVHIFC